MTVLPARLVRAFQGAHAALQALYLLEKPSHRVTKAAAVRLAHTLDTTPQPSSGCSLGVCVPERAQVSEILDVNFRVTRRSGGSARRT